MRLLVKVGGSLVEEPRGRERLAGAVAAALAAGHQVVLLHGGGNQMRAAQARLGIPERYHEGLRVTDAPTAEAALMVLGGLVNRTLVAALSRQGLKAAGLTGADGATFAARRKTASGVDLGYVGEAAAFAPSLVDLLLAASVVPVLASVAPLAPGEDGPDGHFYNINADEAAGPLAVGLGCTATLFLTDVPGVLGPGGTILPTLSSEEAEDLIARGVIRAGMLPKVRAALHAARAGCPLVKILPGEAPDPILGGLSPERGTRVAQSAEAVA